jgi:predicted PurR-regulated permease PerM
MHDLVVIYLSGMTGIWKAIPIGIVLKTPPLSIYLMTVLGASTAVVLIYLFDGWVRQFVQRKMKRDKLMRKKIKMDKLVSKFGVIIRCYRYRPVGHAEHGSEHHNPYGFDGCQ